MMRLNKFFHAWEGHSTPVEKVYRVAVHNYSYFDTFVLGLGSKHFFNHEETFLTRAFRAGDEQGPNIY